MSLATTLSGLLARSAAERRTVPWTLGKGLRVRVTTGPPRLCLWREDGAWGPGEASEREGRVCAAQLGWSAYDLRWQGRYLIVEQQAPLLGQT
ncbi:hypothetical protein [Deinococcus petrolearius]|uniref:Uncharacterized protein n=1 Tax=Deinococcus petrolearius TaxID=1751295 RepID=A0ABW1DG72_9DEIO